MLRYLKISFKHIPYYAHTLVKLLIKSVETTKKYYTESGNNILKFSN